MAQQSAHKAGAPALNDWCESNNVKSGSSSSSTSNRLYIKDEAKHKALYEARPWLKDPHYVRRCYISAVAVLKMLMHGQSGRQTRGGGAGGSSSSAASGGAAAAGGEWLEVMGQFQGHVQDNCVVLTDSFGIPVPATAVECGLDEEATSYLVRYSSMTEEIGKPARVFGWYHTHPGYTAFLSGTDVNTQRFQQMAGGPIVALVLDPVRTLANGKIELKAFRTYPEGYTPTSPADKATRQQIDLECQQQQMLGEADPSAGLIGDGISAINSKKRDVAHFATAYYEVPITIFRSEKDAELLEQLWSRYWSKSFSSSLHIENRDFVNKELGAIATHLSDGKFALPSALAAYNESQGGKQRGTNAATANSTSAATATAPSSSNNDMDIEASRAAVAALGGAGRNTNNANRRPNNNTANGTHGKRGGGYGGDNGDVKFEELLGLSTNMGIDAMQGLLTAHVKQRIFGAV